MGIGSTLNRIQTLVGCIQFCIRFLYKERKNVHTDNHDERKTMELINKEMELISNQNLHVFINIEFSSCLQNNGKREVQKVHESILRRFSDYPTRKNETSKCAFLLDWLPTT